MVPRFGWRSGRNTGIFFGKTIFTYSHGQLESCGGQGLVDAAAVDGPSGNTRTLRSAYTSRPA